MVMIPPKVPGPMTEPFDPYRKWLGIAPKDQPPNHYRLLGIPTFESDPDVIENAAARQMAHVRTYQGSKHAAISQRILTELSAAKLCLFTPERKAAYDAALRAQLRAAGKLSSDSALSGVVPVRAVEVVAAGLPPVVRRGEDRWRTEEPASIAHIELAPVPIPMPASPVGGSMPVVRRGAAARVNSRRQPTTVPLLITIISLVVLLGGAGVAVVVVSNRLSDDAGASSAEPTKAASQRPAARTE